MQRPPRNHLGALSATTALGCRVPRATGSAVVPRVPRQQRDQRGHQRPPERLFRPLSVTAATTMMAEPW